MIPRFKALLNYREIFQVLLWQPRNKIKRFEQAFARFFKAKYAINFPYGRTALYILLKALELKDAEIICPAYTCVVVQNAIITSGNIPICIDAQPDDFNMNLDQVIEAITDNTKMIIATSTFGHAVDLDKIKYIKKHYPHIFILQDCAYSFKAKWQDEEVQTISDAALVGMNISKLITSIFGGMLTTNDESLAIKVRKQKKHLMKKAPFSKSIMRRVYLIAVFFAFSKPLYFLTNWFERHRLLDRFAKYYDEEKITMPNDFLTELTAVESAVGLIQLQKYATIIHHRQSIARFYHQTLSEISAIKLPPLDSGATYSHFNIRVANRRELIDYALTQQIQLGILLEYCVPNMAAHKHYNHSRQYPIASKMAAEVVNLPVTCSLADAKRITTMLSQFYSKDTLTVANNRT